MRSWRNHLLKIMNILLIGIFSLSCAVSHVTGKKQFMLISESQEIQMGKEYDPQVIAAFGEYKDDKLLAFVQGQTQELAKKSHWSSLDYHIKVLDSPVVNAFAVPGGYIYLTRGILAQLNNEAELAGIIGHEMGHITSRHSVSQMSKQQVGQLVVIAGMIASEEFRKYADYAMAGMQLLFLKFSRDDERAADKLGVEYSSKIGYDAHKMADFFLVLNKMNLASNQGGVPTFLSTHPDPGDRYTAVNQSATSWQASLPQTAWKVNRESYLKLIDGIVYGEDPRQGYVEGNTFYHPELKFKFSFPAGWQLENTPAQVNMAPQQGNVMMVFAQAAGNSLQDAAVTTLNDLKLDLLERRNSTVNGLPALQTVSRQVSQNSNTGAQQVIKVLSCFISCEGKNYVFHGVTLENEFNGYSRTLETTMGTFMKLTDPSKMNVKPRLIRVKPVQKEGTVADAFKLLGVAQNKMSETALLNNLELTDRIKAGTLIKIVGQ